jgi:hypothetical protein
MHEYSTLRELVKGTGAILIEEHLNPDVFGSAYAVFSCGNDGRFRLVWDGRDGCGFLQGSADSQWKAVGPVIPEGHVENAHLISEFLTACEALAAANGNA